MAAQNRNHFGNHYIWEHFVFEEDWNKRLLKCNYCSQHITIIIRLDNMTRYIQRCHPKIKLQRGTSSRQRSARLPRTFRTEARDNYIPPTLQPVSQIHNFEEEARSYYEKSIANLSTNIQEEYDAFQKEYSTENSVVGSRRPICSVLAQFVEKNKRLERKSVHI